MLLPFTKDNLARRREPYHSIDTVIRSFKLEPASPIPMYLQLIDQIRHDIAAGRLRPGDELPSVRALASHHLINPNTVARAYLELERQGLLTKRRGAGTYIAENAQSFTAPQRLRTVSDLIDQALAAAEEFDIPPAQVRALIDQRLPIEKEKSA